MLDSLTLKYYRQHVDRTFNFTEELNVIKGANEGGKSTILEALLYLWFGVKGILSEPLCDVVTYGHDEKDLRVEGRYTFEGVTYEAYRSPKGAQITYDDKTVTGQTGTRQFMETLLGAKADIVKKLMIAEQNSVRGILTDDSGAGALIEELAELGLIDVYIEKIQQQKPCGPTKGQEATVATLAESIPDVPPMPSDEAVKLAGIKVEASTQELENLQMELQECSIAAGDAKRVLQEASDHESRRKAMQKRIDELKAMQRPPVCAYTEADVATAEQLEADASYAARVAAERAKKFGTRENKWTGTEESAVDAVAGLRNKLKSFNAEVSELKVKIASKKATAINEGVCAFCKEDISQRPEVLQINSEVSAAVLAMETQKARAESSIIAIESDIATIEGVLQVHRANTRLATPEFWEASVGSIPCVYTWIGPTEVSCQSVSQSSKAIREELAASRQAFDRYESAQAELIAAEVPPAFDVEAVEQANLHIAAAESAAADVEVAKAALTADKHAFDLAKLQYDNEVAARDAAIVRQQQARDTYLAAKKTLEDMLYHNELIKDLREARSEIRRRLWRSVTATISAYFSRIRQKETVIAQSPDGFTQNGRPIKGLSGSAKDMLGLALRASLMKTFIPGATMMFTDEPFSGCDENRETAGIGVLAALGFDQTVLVTHSNLADAVATNLVAV